MRLSVKFPKIALISPLIVLMTLTGCGGGNSIAEKYNLGEGPDLDTSNSLMGTDENKNGIRDDIENYLINTYRDPAQRKATLQYAKSVQHAIMVQVPDKPLDKKPKKKDRSEIAEEDQVLKSESKKAVLEVSRGAVCIYDKFYDSKIPTSGVIIEITSLTANTNARKQAYKRTNKLAREITSFVTDSNSCDLQV